MSDASGVWVFNEIERDEITRASLALLCEGKKISGAIGEELSALLIGEHVECLAGIPPHYGADKVFVIEKSLLSYHDIDSHVSILYGLLREYTPRLVLFAATTLGRELAPRLAARLKASLVTECVEIKLADGRLVARRPVFGDKAHATVVCSPANLQIATVAPGAVEYVGPDEKRTGEIIKISNMIVQPPGVEFVSFTKGDPRTVALTEADRIIAVGRGMKKIENLQIIQELADLLDASVGGTRVAVDLKWMAQDRQIGMTGKMVAPKLFISCGISGQYPHTIGMEGSENIIVINNDRSAPMFKLATLGMLGDLCELVPVFIRRIKDSLAAQEKRET